MKDTGFGEVFGRWEEVMVRVVGVGIGVDVFYVVAGEGEAEV